MSLSDLISVSAMALDRPNQLYTFLALKEFIHIDNDRSIGDVTQLDCACPTRVARNRESDPVL